jgi:hypothetical protein
MTRMGLLFCADSWTQRPRRTCLQVRVSLPKRTVNDGESMCEKPMSRSSPPPAIPMTRSKSADCWLRRPENTEDHPDPESTELLDAKTTIDLNFGKVKRAKDILAIVGPKEMEVLGDRVIAG